MIDAIVQLQLFFEVIIFFSTILMNVEKKNSSMVTTYLVQSIMVVALLSIQAYQEQSIGLFVVTTCMFVIKVIIAPRIFLRFINSSKENFSASTYLNVPITLGAIVLLTFFAQSDVFSPILHFLPHIHQIQMLLLGSLFISLLLMINRKGALSQIIGVLSLENSIFAFGHFLGVKQAVSLEAGILFDVFFWIIISSIFIKMLYRHYGSLDVSELKQLQK